MDCERVFVILTRGPFPTGEPWDEEVEAHLETCADCWRLAEALRPALEVFQEAVPPAESRDLPGYWGDARPAAAVISELSKSSTRLATVAGVRRVARASASQFDNPTAGQLSPDQMRALVLTLSLAATACALGLAWFLL